MSKKSVLRDAVRTALVTAFPLVPWQKDWWSQTDTTALPFGGVSTVRETITRVAVGEVNRAIDLVVVLKREGDADIENTLDADASTIETTVLPVLATVSDDYDLAMIEVSPDPGAQTITGVLVATFRVVLKTQEANPD